MSAGYFLLVALTLLLATLGSRLPWTRFAGWFWAIGAAAAIFIVLPKSNVIERMAQGSPNAAPASLFALLALTAFWWSMNREQEATSAETMENKISAQDLEHDAGGIVWRSAGVCVGLLVIAGLAWLLPPSLPAGDQDVLPWFLAGLGEISHWAGPWIGWMLLPIAALACLFAAPLLDTREPELRARFRGRSDEVPFFLFAWLFLGLLPIVMATCLRPMGWLDPIGQRPLPLGQTFWVDLIGVPAPHLLLIRELPGILILGILFIVLPWRFPSWKPTRGAFSRHRRRLGRRYVPVTFLIACIVWCSLALLSGALLDVGPWLDLGAYRPLGFESLGDKP